MELLEAIRNRRSIRGFQTKDLPQEIIEKLVESATWAPSAGNVQPYIFIIVRSNATKNQLSKAALDQQSLLEAPVVIVICANLAQAYEAYGERGESLYCIQDTAAATQNILLTAHSLGLGTCWIGAFKEEEVGKIINVPRNIRPVAMIPVGYPDETPQARDIKPIEEIMRQETF